MTDQVSLQLNTLLPTQEFVISAVILNGRRIQEVIERIKAELQFNKEKESTRIKVTEELGYILKRYNRFMTSLSSDLKHEMEEIDRAYSTIQSEIRSHHATPWSDSGKGFSSQTYTTNNKSESNINGANSSNLINAICANTVTIVNNNGVNTHSQQYKQQNRNEPFSEIASHVLGNQVLTPNTAQFRPAFVMPRDYSSLSQSENVFFNDKHPEIAIDSLKSPIYNDLHPISLANDQNILGVNINDNKLVRQSSACDEMLANDVPAVELSGIFSDNDNNSILEQNDIKQEKERQNMTILDQQASTENDHNGLKVYEDAANENREDQDGTHMYQTVYELSEDNEQFIEQRSDSKETSESAENDDFIKSEHSWLSDGEDKTPKPKNVEKSNTESSAGTSIMRLVKRFKYPSLVNTFSYKCWAVYTESPLLIWIQMDSDTKIIKNFEKNINEFYNDKVNSQRYAFDPASFNVDSEYAAQYLNYWYRAKILSINRANETARVFYYDYGNSEKVTFENLRRLHKKFTVRGPFAYPITLAKAIPKENNKHWTTNDVTRFREFLLNRELMVSKFMALQVDWPIDLCKILVKTEDKQSDALCYMVKIKRAVEVDNYRVQDLFAEQMKILNKKYNFKDHEERVEEIMVDTSVLNQIQYSSTINATSSSFIDVHRTTISGENSSNAVEPSKNAKSVTTEVSKSNGPSSSPLPPLPPSPPSPPSPQQQQKSASARELETFFNQLSAKNYYLTLENLPSKYLNLDEMRSFDFEIINIVDPYEFYIALIESKKDFVNLENEINMWYSKNKHNLVEYMKQPNRNYNFVMTGKLCILEDENNSRKFYRALIRYAPPLKRSCMGVFTSSEQAAVFCIDYGLNLSVPISRLYPIFEDFCTVSPRCIAGKFDKITPKDSLVPDDNEFWYEFWSQKAISLFKITLKGWNVIRGTINSYKQSDVKNAGTVAENLIKVNCIDQLSVIFEYGVDSQRGEKKLDLAHVMVEANHARFSSFARTQPIQAEENQIDAENEMEVCESASQIEKSMELVIQEDGEKEKISLNICVELTDDYEKFKELRMQTFIDQSMTYSEKSNEKRKH